MADNSKPNRFKMDRLEDRITPSYCAPVCGGGSHKGGSHKGGSKKAFASLQTVTSLQAKYQMHKSLNAPEANAADEFIANLEDAKPADKCTANYIKMSVASDAKSYTISIPANGHTRTYATVAK